MEQLPRIRTDIQLVPATLQGRRVLAVVDNLNTQNQSVCLIPEIVRLLPLFDGRHTKGDLQTALMRSRGNQLVMSREVDKLVDDLDQLLILESDRYRQKKKAQVDAFVALAARPATHLGQAYPAEEHALREMIAQTLESGEPYKAPPAQRICALVAPHIDIKIGRQTYAKAYAAISQLKPQRLVILGTAHSAGRELISLTTKDYLTPLGSFPTDQQAVARLKGAGGPLVAPHDFAHAHEHSIEFQLVFLRHLFPQKIPLIPILLGSFYPYLKEVERPTDIPHMAAFLRELRGLIDEHTLVVAGVDLSHVGPKFGHQEPAAAFEAEFRGHDKALLANLEKGSVTGLWAESKGKQDCFHVCGFPALACLLELFNNLSCEILDYRTWDETETRSAVTFAAGVGTVLQNAS